MFRKVSNFKIKCYYAKDCLLAYENVREEMQWTLDN